MQSACLVSALCLAVCLCGCAASSAPPASPAQGVTLVQKGRITEVVDVSENDGRHGTAGAAIGSGLGGIAGSTIGGGHGRTIASIGGAAARGVVGHAAGRTGSERLSSRISVRTEDGMLHTFFVDRAEAFRVGEDVRIMSTNGNLRISR